MVYDYTCQTDGCGITIEVSGVKLTERELPQICEQCGGLATFDFGSTVRGARTYYQQNFYSYVEEKFAKNPYHQHAKGNAGRGDMERVGEEHMRHLKRQASERLLSGRFTPGEETQLRAMANQPIKSRPKQWSGQEGAKRLYPGDPGDRREHPKKEA